ncbi:MAG: ABC transporter ATP-binding protein/permease [Bacilli bacterium]|nr:ABC transporter ATP-binding protein/permease [Bacilli bacterium]
MLKLKNIKKFYKTGDFKQQTLKDVSVEFRENEFVAILGPSGSGKTTLLNIIGGLDKYDSGDLIINGKSTKKFKNKDFDAYRNNCIGFIFQSYNLINHISILENVEMSMTLSGISKRKRKKKALELLKKVGLKQHAHKKPNQLSGGQMQRVAIARALANDPNIILADEPTGALDSKTSIQIMKLIEEIAKDKLVIMVTHNPELASTYASRIIEFKDGEMVSDSNPFESKENNNEIKIRKTKMNFLTALNLSFNNIKTKKGRTLITSFASSIGIIGIALILSLSNGFQIQIDKFEKETLSQMPIAITPEYTIMDEESSKKLMEDIRGENKKVKDGKITALKSFEALTHKNNITEEYINYIENIDSSYIGGISYNRITRLNLLYKNNNAKLITSNILFPLPESDQNENIITDNFDVIYGNMPKEYNELVLLIDSKNRLDEKVLNELGYTTQNEIDFEDIVNKEIKVVLNDTLYKKYSNFFIQNTDYEDLYDDESNITLKITGIIRGKEDNQFAKLSGTGLCYKESLMEYVMEKNNDSEIVKEQTNSDYNVLTGKKFDYETEDGKKEKDNTLALLGAKTTPFSIQIYPKNFDYKDKLTQYLDNYNKSKKEEDKILYTDYAEAITSLSGNIMSAITIVLIAFSTISLIVSSIMIGIIIYISVLERTKEIGILRALGARKKDITRVFNAETFIIGLSSGILGITIANILIIPANIILKDLSGLENVARLNPLHALILISISITLTLLGGFIPSIIAAKKDPVEALRTE